MSLVRFGSSTGWKPVIRATHLTRGSSAAGQGIFQDRHVERRHFATHDGFYTTNDLADGEGLAAHLVEPFRINEEASPQDHAQLAEVHLRYQHVIETFHQFAQLRWQRVQITNVTRRHRLALLLKFERSGRDGAVGAAPAND